MKSTRPTTAVIAAAGRGTRFLPWTSTINKCLLPVLNRPMIDYVIRSCTEAQVTDIIIMVPQGDTLVKKYVTAELPQAARFRIVELHTPGIYGTAIPLLHAAEHIDAYPVLYLAGDDVVHSEGEPEVSKLIETFETTGADAALMATTVPKAEVGQYGVLAIKGPYNQLVDFVEKPAPEEAPSDLINISKYLVPEELVKSLPSLQRHEGSQEHRITDALIAYARNHLVVAHRIKGKYLDAGTVDGWLAANNFMYQQTSKQ